MAECLSGKVALIAGSASGMGAAGATKMAEEGAKVVSGDVRLAQAEKRWPRAA